MRRVLAALLAVTALGMPAEGDTPDAVFTGLASANPDVALGLAWSVNGGTPHVLVSGPTRRGGPPVAPEALWHVGSITKSFTAALALVMAEAGEIDLDGAVAAHLPGETLHPDWQGVTFREALSHTGGLPANVSPLSLFRPGPGSPDEQRLTQLRRLWSDPLPGSRGEHAYSNIGYVFAGAALEAATGTPWERLVRERVAAPAGLGSVGLGPPRGEGDPRGHRRIAGVTFAVEPARPWADNPAWMGPAGTLHMSLGDLLGWAETLRLSCAEGALISRESCAAMSTPQAGSYGLGLVVESLAGGGRLVWHNGSNTMWYAVVGFLPERGIALAVTLNRFDRALGDALFAAAREALMAP